MESQMAALEHRIVVLRLQGHFKTLGFFLLFKGLTITAFIMFAISGAEPPQQRTIQNWLIYVAVILSNLIFILVVNSLFGIV